MPTSNVDVVPTLAAIGGARSPAWGEGRILPGFGNAEDPDRQVFVLDAKGNSAFTPLTKMTLAMIRGDYKIIHYRGYGGAYDLAYEFYDLRNDPEELEDRYKDPKYASVVADMRAALLAELNAKDQPHQKR